MPHALEEAIAGARCDRIALKHPECIAAAVRCWLAEELDALDQENGPLGDDIRDRLLAPRPLGDDGELV